MSEDDFDEFYRIWNEFGRNMNLIAILTLLTIATGITGFVAIIFMLISLGNIKLLNSKIKSLYLHDFRSKMISSFLYKIIAICLMVIGGIQIAFSVYYWMGYSSSLGNSGVPRMASRCANASSMGF